MRYSSIQNAPDYFPPILSNGDLSFPVDCEGAVFHTGKDFPPVEGFESVIYRAGHRLDFGHDRVPGILVSFGKLQFCSTGKISAFTQELREEEGLVCSRCTYDNGAEVETVSFIHPDAPLYCVRKTVLSGELEAAWQYQLCGYSEDTQKAILSTSQTLTAQGGRLEFTILGQDIYCGNATVELDKTTSAVWDSDILRLPISLREGESVTLYFSLTDNLDSPRQLSRDYETLLAQTKTSWQDYFSRSYVKTSDETLNQIYRTALYHLRCYTTQWSIAVGISNLHWHGRYFAFDEYYGLLGLLGAGQWELARRVPDYRLKVCLPKAIRRQTSLTQEQARFPWITNEYGEETAIPGFWIDHVFHMSLIALGAFEYYEYTQDKAFLEQCYPMIRACAQFFSQHMIYRTEDGAFLGKCSDLERLGSSVENPFMSSCGAIRTLEVAAQAAKLLGIDQVYQAECLELSDLLRKSLPVEEDRYVPYRGCDQRSVGVFAGKFPFNVLKNDDSRMLHAWKDFIENGAAYGNMYKIGTQLSPWYACWQAEGFARIANGDLAYDFLQKAYPSTGVFGEMFEINEPDRRLRPWFMTAAGIYLSTVQDMLVQSDGKTIHLLPACPLADVSFKLPVKGGAMLEVEVKAGKLCAAVLTSSTPKAMTLVYKDTTQILRT
jgi:hypothetical protein